MSGTIVTLTVWQRIMGNAAMSADRVGGIVEIAQAVAGDGQTAIIAIWFSGRTMFGFTSTGSRSSADRRRSSSATRAAISRTSMTARRVRELVCALTRVSHPRHRVSDGRRAS